MRPIAYVVKPGKKPVMIHSTLDATDPEGMAREMETRSSGRSRCHKCAIHIVFSLADHEHLSFNQWREVDQLFREKFGYDHGMLVTHGDTGHEHAHFVGSRCRLNGKAVPSSFERLRLRQFCREMEEHFDLVRTPERSARVRVSKDEIEKADRLYRTGKQATAIPERMGIAVAVQAAFRQSPSLLDFEDTLRRQQVTTRWRYNEQGEPVGVSFGRGEASISGKHAGVSARMLTLHFSGKGTATHEQSRGFEICSGAAALDRAPGPANCRADPARHPGTNEGAGGNTPPAAGPSRDPGDFLGDNPAIVREVGNLVVRALSGLAIMCDDMARDGERFHGERTRRPRPPIQFIRKARIIRREITR